MFDREWIVVVNDKMPHAFAVFDVLNVIVRGRFFPRIRPPFGLRGQTQFAGLVRRIRGHSDCFFIFRVNLHRQIKILAVINPIPLDLVRVDDLPGVIDRQRILG